MKCPYCGSSNIILDQERGEYICTSCGTVIADHLPDISHEESRFYTYDEYLHRARTHIARLGTSSTKKTAKEIQLLGQSRGEAYQVKVMRCVELFSEVVMRYLGIDFNLLQHFDNVCSEVSTCEKQYCKNVPTRAVVFGMGIHMLKIFKRIDIPMEKLSRIAREMRVGKYMLEALSCTRKYIERKYGRNIMLLSILDEAVKHIREEYRPTIRKIVMKLIDESSILKTIYRTRKQCAVYVLTAVLVSKLFQDYGKVDELLNEAVSRGLCSRWTCREMYREFSRTIRIELADG